MWMKRFVWGKLILSLFSFFMFPSCQWFSKTSSQGDTDVLAPAPTTLYKYKEIAIQYNDELFSAFNNLMPEERIFVYYIFRASLPGNRMIADQLHRYSLEIINIFETIFKAKEMLENSA